MLLTGKRILIVEDEYYLADDLREALRAAGAEVVGPAASIAEAEARLDEGGFDAALLDMNLRGETARPLAARLLAEKLPFLIVSGYSEGTLPPELAAAPHLEKPVNCSHAVALLAKMLPPR